MDKWALDKPNSYFFVTVGVYSKNSVERRNNGWAGVKPKITNSIPEKGVHVQQRV